MSKDNLWLFYTVDGELGRVVTHGHDILAENYLRGFRKALLTVEKLTASRIEILTPVDYLAQGGIIHFDVSVHGRPQKVEHPGYVERHFDAAELIRLDAGDD